MDRMTLFPLGITGWKLDFIKWFFVWH